MLAIFDDNKLRQVMELAFEEKMAEDAKYMGFLNDGGLSVFSISRYNGIDAEISVMSDGENPPLIGGSRKFLDYCFNIAKCRRVTALIYKNNKKARRMAKIFGFVEEGTLRRAGKEGQNVIIVGLLASDYYQPKLKRAA